MSRAADAARATLRGCATLALVAALAVALPAAAAKRPRVAAKPKPVPGALPPVEVRDLYYGDVLFYFYQDDYFTALTRLTAAQLQNRLAHHSDDAELLLGGLYLSLGQHLEAGRIFAEVLDRPKVPAAVRDRARFFLGKVWYQRGYLDKAAATLAAAGSGGLSPDMDAERRMLLAQAYLFQGHYPQAAALLKDWKGPVIWQAYAQFNLGIALVRSGQLDDGAKLLDAVGRLERTNRELDALKDKANVALGYALLQANRPAEAGPVLERVRLEGPLSSKALLGVGWAATGVQHYREALVPWLELQHRGLLDSAVQESYLAVPYAYSKLGADRQASQAYEIALVSFDEETARIDESIAAIRGGGLVESIITLEGRGRSGWAAQLARLPDAPESRYLYHLLAQNEFQEGLKNFRMMLRMGRDLETWDGNVEVFDEMLETRRERYETRLPAVLAKLDSVDLEELRRRRTDLESRIVGAESNGDFATLGTPRERAMWAEIEHMDGVLTSAGAGSDSAGEAAEGAVDTSASDGGYDLDALRDRVRLLKGVLYWQMNDAFKARAWAARKNLREVAKVLRASEQRWSLVQEARSAGPARNDELELQIATLRPRIDDARLKLAELEQTQGRYLADIAVRELESQKQRLATYSLQARYALATIYDRSGADVARPAAPAAAEPVP